MKATVITADKGKLNLRAEPNKQSRVLTQIPYGTNLEIEYVDSTWSQTTYKDWTGYVMTKYLSCGNPITKSDLQQIVNSLKATLETIENILK